MKLEDFLYDWLTNMLEFEPTRQLQEAIHSYVYKGTVDGPPAWGSNLLFKDECDKGAEFFIRFQLGKLNEYR